MITAKSLALVVVVVLAPCLATIAQPSNAAPATSVVVNAPTPPAPPPNTAEPLVKPPDSVVAEHGTASEPTAAATTLTNEPGVDEVSPMIALNGVPLNDAVTALALQANLNIQIDPRLLSTVGPDGHLIAVTQPVIDAKWKNVTAKQALTAMLDNYGWQLIINPLTPIGRVTAKDPKALEPLVTQVIQLEYSNPSNIVAEVQATLSPRSTIATDPRTHKLVIRTTVAEMAGVESLIASLDTATRQVLIEAKLIQTSKAINSAKGIDWTKTLAAQNVSFGNGTTAGTVNQSIASATIPVTTGTTTTPGGTTIPTSSGGGIASGFTNMTSLVTTIAGLPSSSGGLSLSTAHGFSPATAFLNADGLQAVISFLNTDSDTRTVNFPRTVALDGVQTELMVVQNIPIFEQQQSAPAAGASQGLATVLPNYDKVVGGTILNEVGTKLTVTPRIAGPTNVLLDVKPEISSVDAQVASDTLDGQISTSPIFDRSRITTQASVPSGYTLVLGGLESDNDTKTYTKVPFLGDLPGLGYLFSSSNKGRTRSTILIFVTPTIINDSDFQPANSQFLKTKGISVSNTKPAPWDTGEPYDWTKPKPGVEPIYQP